MLLLLLLELSPRFTFDDDSAFESANDDVDLLRSGAGLLAAVVVVDDDVTRLLPLLADVDTELVELLAVIAFLPLLSLADGELTDCLECNGVSGVNCLKQ
jgi:hypothetical protein